MLVDLQIVFIFVCILSEAYFIHGQVNTVLTNLTSNDKKCSNQQVEETASSFVELAAKYGHPAQSYEVVTEDGYKLTVFRIPGKDISQPNRTLPILLFHGISDSSDTWIIRGNISLSITLAREGRDVWLGNVRGNKYSKGHVYLDPIKDAAAYWNFTFNEHGIYDLATTIDLVLNETGAERLDAYGHSQGNTIFYVLCSSKPAYNSKINFIAALAPIAYLHHTSPPVSTAIELSQILTSKVLAFNAYKIFDANSTEVKLIQAICPLPIIGYDVCAYGILFPINGLDPAEFEPCFLDVLIRHFPDAASVKNLRHFGQVGLSKRFARYDYGEAGNRIAYNSSLPPVYDLSKVTTRVILLPGMNDHISTLQDVAILRRQLPNVVRYRVIPRPNWNHIDFIFGKHMPQYLYPDLLQLLQIYD